MSAPTFELVVVAAAAAAVAAVVVAVAAAAAVAQPHSMRALLGLTNLGYLTGQVYCSFGFVG